MKYTLVALKHHSITYRDPLSLCILPIIYFIGTTNHCKSLIAARHTEKQKYFCHDLVMSTLKVVTYRDFLFTSLLWINLLMQVICRFKYLIKLLLLFDMIGKPCMRETRGLERLHFPGKSLPAPTKIRPSFYYWNYKLSLQKFCLKVLSV